MLILTTLFLIKWISKNSYIIFISFYLNFNNIYSLGIIKNIAYNFQSFNFLFEFLWTIIIYYSLMNIID
jgi:hypothetical protein